MIKAAIFDIDGSIYPHRRQSPGGWYSPRLNISVVDEFDEALLDHEANHYQIHAATPYGVFYKALCNLADVLVLDCVTAIRNNAPAQKIPVPLYRFARGLRQGNLKLGRHEAKALARPIDDYIAPWSALVALQSIFEGGQSAAAVEPAAEQACQLLARFERLWWERGSKLGRPPVPVTSAPPESVSQNACPIATTSGGTRIGIGAMQIVEAIAVLIEHKEKIYLPLDKSDTDDFMEYSFLWTWYLSSLIQEGDFSKDSLSLYRNTFLICAFLALFSPCGPYFFDLRVEGRQWKDLHPGWRFLKAITASRQLGLVGSIQQDGLRYAEQVCDRLDWPRIGQFLDLGAGLEGALDIEASIKASFAHQAAVLAPEPDPALVERLLDELLADHGPLFWIKSDRLLRSNLKNAAAYGSLIRNAVLSEWAWTVMLVGVPDTASIFNHGIEFFPVLGGEYKSNAEFHRAFIARNKWMDPGIYRRFSL